MKRADMSWIAPLTWGVSYGNQILSGAMILFSVGLFYIIGAGTRRQMEFLCIGIEDVIHLL